MKAKTDGRMFVTRTIRTMRVDAVRRVSGPIDPRSQPRPFLVHALRLRARLLTS